MSNLSRPKKPCQAPSMCLWLAASSTIASVGTCKQCWYICRQTTRRERHMKYCVHEAADPTIQTFRCIVQWLELDGISANEQYMHIAIIGRSLLQGLPSTELDSIACNTYDCRKSAAWDP